MSQNHKQLFSHCVQVLNAYNHDTQSVDEHVNRYLKENGVCIKFVSTKSEIPSLYCLQKKKSLFCTWQKNLSASFPI